MKRRMGFHDLVMTASKSINDRCPPSGRCRNEGRLQGVGAGGQKEEPNIAFWWLAFCLARKTLSTPPISLSLPFCDRTAARMECGIKTPFYVCLANFSCL